MSSVLALPPPSSLPASTTSGRARALLSSDALPVTAIRPTPDEERRRQLRQAAAQDGLESAASEDAGLVGGNRRRNAAASERRDADSRHASSRDEQPRIDLQTRNAGPAAGFVAQSLYQENMSAGLHIEPWEQALGAYRRAESAGLQGARSSLAI